MPVDAVDTQRYGGATICLHVDLGGGNHLVLDAGTGLRYLPDYLGEDAKHFTFLITHYHWDHVLGLPFFPPVYQPQFEFTFYGHKYGDMTLERAVEGVFGPPWFPISVAETPSIKTFIPIDGKPFHVGPVTVSTAELYHPQGVTSYRLDHEGRSMVLATDTEAGDPDADQRLIQLAHGANVLLHDAQYLPGELNSHHGWGHSSWEHAVDMAQRAEVEKLVLVSHDPMRTDEGVDDIVAAARARFENTEAAHIGMEIPL